MNRATLRYSDADGDWVTVRCDDELIDALSLKPLRAQLCMEPTLRDRPRMDGASIVSRQEGELIARQEVGAITAPEVLGQAGHEADSKERRKLEAVKGAATEQEEEERVRRAAACSPSCRQVAIKASIEDGAIRKLLVDQPISLTSLQAEIAKELGLNGSTSMKFEYTDEDKDIIAVMTDSELQLAFEQGCSGHRVTFLTQLDDTAPQTRQQWLQPPPPPLGSGEDRRLHRQHGEARRWQEERESQRAQEEGVLQDARLALQLQDELDAANYPAPAGSEVQTEQSRHALVPSAPYPRPNTHRTRHQ